ncbi:uncharacterized protein EV154DRAFT_484922 [Mucor mucedo]|uniref:uncharacterized protein n=1 Tax=Mucor mucedo TaxID=29922 RepID=UPI00221F16E2|nr:uncharacterized protein EV154DRAFT_484922 [Mucor mucedo]KAI7887619.1 hypothetical protein EV154DRAFT_484922 [Mucor mucedo]
MTEKNLLLMKRNITASISLRYTIATIQAGVGGSCGFVQGQPFLDSVTRQLKENGLYVDDRNHDKVKINFDHHKGIFGVFSVLKLIADNYPVGPLVRLFFLHAADRILNLHRPKHAKASPLESMFLANGVFDLWREACLEIKPKLEDRHDHLPESAQFLWTMKCLLEEAVVNIDMLKKEHKKATAKYRYRSEGLTKLTPW